VSWRKGAGGREREGGSVRNEGQPVTSDSENERASERGGGEREGGREGGVGCVCVRERDP
jgi:hypothetical protein